MKLGDAITLAGIPWTVRPFTAAEHQRFDELAEVADLQKLAAELEAARGARSGTMREQLLTAHAKAATKRLSAYLDGDELRSDLSEDEKLAAFEIAAEIDLFTEQAESIRGEKLASVIALEDELAERRDAVTSEFMSELLSPYPLAEFRARLEPEDYVTLDAIVAVGKLRAGLSAWTRRQTASWAQVLAKLEQQQASSGNASESQPQPPGAPPKPGRSGRSRKSSSTSMAGA
jgi:hypothetical protein